MQDILSVRVAGLVRNLPSGVTDIDAEDEDNSQLCAEYAPVSREDQKSLIAVQLYLYCPYKA